MQRSRVATSTSGRTGSESELVTRARPNPNTIGERGRTSGPDTEPVDIATTLDTSPRTDGRVLRDVRHNLSRLWNVDASDIEVRVDDGVVTLTGTVEQRHARHLVESEVAAVVGVRQIDNRLRVSKERDGVQIEPAPDR